jgi:hypothetical protein
VRSAAGERADALAEQDGCEIGHVEPFVPPAAIPAICDVLANFWFGRFTSGLGNDYPHNLTAVRREEE